MASELIDPSQDGAFVSQSCGTQITVREALEKPCASVSPITCNTRRMNYGRLARCMQDARHAGDFQAEVQIGIGKDLPATNHREVGLLNCIPPLRFQPVKDFAQFVVHQQMPHGAWEVPQQSQDSGSVTDNRFAKSPAPREIDVGDVQARPDLAKRCGEAIRNYPVAQIWAEGNAEDHDLAQRALLKTRVAA
jgi:hypothetical protein